MKVKSLSRVRLLVTPWTAAHQAPQSMGFSRQEYWSGVPLPSPSLNPSLSLKMMLIYFGHIYIVAQMVKHLPTMQETQVQSQGREAPGEGNSNRLQYSCLENPIDRGAW